MKKKRDFIPLEQLVKLYWKKGLTTLQIAKIFSCAQRTIQIRMQECNIPLRPRGNKLEIPKEKLFEFYINQRLSSRKIAKSYRCVYSTIDRKIREYGFPIRTLANAHIVTLRKPFSGNKTEKAYLLGFAIGDLRVRKMYKNSETILIDCGSTKKEQIKLVKSLFKHYGRIWISKPTNAGKTHIECSVDLSFNFLLENDHKIPKWILRRKKFFAGFLSGFTDAEGSIFISKGKATYSLGNYNYHLLNQIYVQLIKLGIKLKLPRRGTLKGYKDRQGYRRKADYWTLAIHRKSSLLKLFNLISPHLKHAKRKNDVKKAIRNIKERNKKFGNLRMG